MIPKKIKVCNITYKVRFEDLEDDFGTHSTVNQEIIISTGLSDEMTRNTLFHELVHAIFFQVGALKEQKNEVLVQAVANELDKLFEFKSEIKKQ